MAGEIADPFFGIGVEHNPQRFERLFVAILGDVERDEIPAIPDVSAMSFGTIDRDVEEEARLDNAAPRLAGVLDAHGPRGAIVHRDIKPENSGPLALGTDDPGIVNPPIRRRSALDKSSARGRALAVLYEATSGAVDAYRRIAVVRGHEVTIDHDGFHS